MEEQEEEITIVEIREEIVDLHKNIQLCINEQFAKPENEILEAKEIQTLCTGEGFSIVLRFYQEINQKIKEITKE